MSDGSEEVSPGHPGLSPGDWQLRVQRGRDQVHLDLDPPEHGRRPGAGPVPDDHLAPRAQAGQDEEWGQVSHLPQV